MRLSTLVVLTFGILFQFQLACCDATAEAILKSKLGRIRGSILISDEGNEFYAFRGIPFAEAPVKELRFSPPQPYDKEYNGILDATEDGNDCIQYNHFEKTFNGDEDCLYLNVYVPKLPAQDFKELLPVMVWFHGGGFFSGSGSSSDYGPQRLVDRKVILVSTNYRLGPFGFLSTSDEASPGNFGLLDQVLALKWVRDNIATFGGQPNKVTIFGESAGSMSVGLHLLSPLSKGFFHAAIAQSGSALPEFLVAQDETDSVHFAEEVAQKLKCPTDCKKKMIACLRRKPALDIIIKSALIVDNYTESSGDIITFKPVVDTAYGTNAFLPDFPKNLMANKKFNAVPLIVGANKDEGILLISSLRGFGGVDSFGKEHIPLLLKSIAPSLFDIETQASQLLYAEYFENVDGSNLKQKLVGLNKFFSDLFITYMVDAQNDYYVESGMPTYVYKFTHQGQHSVIDFLPFKALFSGDSQFVAHADEVQNLFHGAFINSKVLSSEKDKKMSDIMLTLWTNFAKTGIPTMEGSVNAHPAFNWEPSASGNHQYLDLNANNPHMVKDRLSYSYKTWNNIYKLANHGKDEL